jgi:hypothetical protein
MCQRMLLHLARLLRMSRERDTLRILTTKRMMWFQSLHIAIAGMHYRCHETKEIKKYP